jgi:predicted enzyme related to lactoylglutathione lyase
MKTAFRLILFILSGLTLMLPLPASAHEIEFERFGLYVLVDDLEGARGFYERLFGGPQVRTPTLIGFNVSGGLYAVVLKKAYAPEAGAGGSVRPYIKVGDLEAVFAHVKAAAPESIEREGVVKEGPFSFFRIRDPEGTVIEFFSVAVALPSLP